MDTIEEGILNALVCSAPNLQKLEIRHFGNKPFNFGWKCPNIVKFLSIIANERKFGMREKLHTTPVDENDCLRRWIGRTADTNVIISCILLFLTLAPATLF